MAAGDVPDLRGVPRTMILPLRARADEHARPDALFRDDLAVRWSTQLPLPDALAELYDWRMQIGHAARTRTFDDAAERFIAGRDRPLVAELGAGLSTRYTRIGRGRGRWVELDLPEAVAVRRRLEAESDEHTFLAHSLLDDAWMGRLPDAAPRDTLFIAEGVLVFLDPADVARLVLRMRERFAGATILLDVGGQALRQGLGEGLERAGAPLRWLVQDERDVEALGLELVNVWPLVRQHPERWGEIAALPWTPSLRAGTLLIEAELTPLGPS